MKTQRVEGGFLASSSVRIIGLIITLIIAAAVVIIAIEDNDAPVHYMNYDIVHIAVDYKGDINVLPHTQEYGVEESNGNIFIRLMLGSEIQDVIINVPYGWTYEIVESEETYYSYNNNSYNNHDYYDARSYYYDNNQYNNHDYYYDHSYYNDHDYYDIHGYHNAYDYYNIHRYYNDYSYYNGDSYYDYNDYDTYEPDNNQRYIVVKLVPMYIGAAPSYFGAIPFGAGRRVNFNPNGGNAFEGHTYRYTVANGTIGSPANMPYMPWRTGARFLWWSTEPDGRDPAVTHISQTAFDYNTLIPEGGLNLYAIWVFTVSFFGNGMALPNPNPNNPINPNSYLSREIPEGWNFVEAEAFGLPVTFPWNPRRQGFQFWGWYDQRIDGGYIGSPPTQPPGVNSVNRYSPITENVEFAARWRLHTHLVMFDMNHSNAVLAAGTAAQPQRLYRWVLNNRSIADSGLGGNANTGRGAIAGTSVDGAPWTTGGTGHPLEYYRQNIRRDWIPNSPPGPGYIPRWNSDGTPNASFTTPYYPGSGLVRGPDGGSVGTTEGSETALNAGTAWPRSAPNVYMANSSGTLETWIPFPAAPDGSNATSRARYTLEGWWTTPDGWAQNWGAGVAANIVGRRFAPAGNTSTHTSAETGTATSNPTGFPIGLARPVIDVIQLPIPAPPATPPPLIPPTGIVSGGEMEDVSGDITVYAQWVFRVTFNLNIPGISAATDGHGVQGFALVGATNFNPSTNNNINFRDIPAHLPLNERTINQNGQRIRSNAGTFTQAPGYGQAPVSTTFTHHQPFWAGMPPYSSPHRAAHHFNGWWDRPVTTISHTHYQNCALCNNDPFAYPAVHHGAQRITGATEIDGNMTAYAHWRFFPIPTVHVRFHLNAPIAPSADTENVHGNSYWPTGRPMIAGYDNPHGRFFLNRLATGTTNLGKPPGVTALTESTQQGTIVTRYTSGAVLAANVYYGNRYAPYIRRTYGYGNPTNASQVAEHHRFPRNPRRTGYVFVGWSTNPNLPAFNAATGNPTGVAGTTRNDNLIWAVNTPINTASAQTPMGGTLDLYAVWAPAIDIIIHGNGNTGPGTHTQFTRPMPFDPNVGAAGGGFTFNEMNNAARWASANVDGKVWFASMYAHATLRASIFSRTGFTPIGPTNAYNTDQLARAGHGSIILGTTRFNNDFFSLFPANNIQPNPTGNDYLRIYIQWGSSLTFNSNFSTFDPSLGNTARVVNMPAGQSVNMTFDPLLRHSHLPNREDVWPSPWAGTTGVDGTRGGWPRDPRAAGRTSDIDGGDWFALFTQPLVRGWSLMGWHRRASGVCPPTCTFDECWFTPDTIINDPITIFAIWGPYIIFDPGLGGVAVNMDPVRHPVTNELHWRVNVGHPFPTPHPGAPTWPLEQNFIGWFPTIAPDPTDPASGATMLSFDVNVQFARRYYAVWNTMIIFNPIGPPGSTAAAGGGMINTIGVAGTPLNRVHFVGRYINIIPSAGEFPTRPGWPNDAFTGHWFAVDTSFPNNRRLYHPNDPAGSGSRIVMGGATLYPEWLSTITFRPGHTRGRLDGLATEITRQVPDGLSLNANAATQRTPAATSANYTGPDWPNDPGLTFGGWRRVNAAGQPLNPDGTIVASGAPLPALLTTDQVNSMVTAGPRYYFEAVWSLRLEFFKVNDIVNPQHPLGFNVLPGARFVLDRYVTGTGWVQAYPVLPLTYIESDSNGRVFISSTFAPLLELPRDTNIDFRLRETQAPTGYVTPTGHWIVTISHQLGVMPTFVPHGNNPAFSAITAPSGSLAGRRQFVSNTPYGGFEFWKVCPARNPLPGAHFQMVRFNGIGTPNLPEPGLVTQAMIGSGANQWSIVGTTQISSSSAPMVFPLRPGRYYHLIESVTPAGFQRPLGQWRITVDNSGSAPVLNITPMGNVYMPGIIPAEHPDTYYMILNLPDFQLPMTGEQGMRTFVMVGSSVLIIALMGVAFIILLRRKRVV